MHGGIEAIFYVSRNYKMNYENSIMKNNSRAIRKEYKKAGILACAVVKMVDCF